jgi:hypothetical protein
MATPAAPEVVHVQVRLPLVACLGLELVGSAAPALDTPAANAPTLIPTVLNIRQMQ